MSEIRTDTINNASGDNDSGIDLSTNDQVIIKTANTTAVTVDSSQNTTFAGNITSTGIDDNATSTAITIDSSDNVAIGSTDPQGFPLQVNSGVAGNIARFTDGVNANTVIKTSGSVTTFGPDTTNSLAFQANNSEKMRIDTNGKVQISSDGAADGFLHIKQNYQTDIGMSLNDTSGSGGTAMRFKVNGSTKGEISFNTSNTTYATSSDYRLKENVVDMTDATTRLKQLQPKRFNFIEDADDTTVDGFLAHEVQSVVPEAITGTHNEVEVWKDGEELPDGVSVGDNKLDDDGNTIPIYQGIDQSKLVPLLVKTIQELEARITALENA